MKKEQAETRVYIFSTIFTILGTGLAMAGLLLPYWYEVSREDGIVIVEAEIGVWQDRICRGDTGCENFWIDDGDYERHADFKMPKEDVVKYTSTMGVSLGLFTILLLIPLWATHLMGSRGYIKRGAFAVYFTCVMVAGFMCEIGVLSLASKVSTSKMGVATFFPGIGGALLFIAGTMSCVVCRYDPSYGTLENPVSPTFVQA